MLGSPGSSHPRMILPGKRRSSYEVGSRSRQKLLHGMECPLNLLFGPEVEGTATLQLNGPGNTTINDSLVGTLTFDVTNAHTINDTSGQLH